MSKFLHNIAIRLFVDDDDKSAIVNTFFSSFFRTVDVRAIAVRNNNRRYFQQHCVFEVDSLRDFAEIYIQHFALTMFERSQRVVKNSFQKESSMQKHCILTSTSKNSIEVSF